MGGGGHLVSCLFIRFHINDNSFSSLSFLDFVGLEI
jgi:hypothetical protein